MRRIRDRGRTDVSGGIQDPHRTRWSIPAGYQLSVIHPVPGWILVCAEPEHQVPAVLRKRIPIWTRSMDLDGGYCLGRASDRLECGLRRQETIIGAKPPLIGASCVDAKPRCHN